MAIDPVTLNALTQTRSLSLIDTLREGQTVEAKVSAVVSQTLARLLIGQQTLDVATSQALTLGSTLVLKAEKSADGLKLVVQNPQQALAQTGNATTAQTNAAATQRVATTTTQTPLPATATQQTAPTASSAATASPAVPGGPLPFIPGQFSSPQLLASIPLPKAALSPASAIATEEPPAIVPVMATSESDAVTDLPNAAASEANALADERAAAFLRLGPPSSDPRLALVQMQRQAADRQTSLSPLFADLSALTEQADQGQRSALPSNVMDAARSVLALRLDGDASITSDKLKTALGQSGLFLESRLADRATGISAQSLPADLKSGLLKLVQTLRDHGFTAAPADRAMTDRAPVKGGQPLGQAAREPSLTSATDDATALSRLRSEGEAGLARIELSQAASLNDARLGGLSRNDTQPVLHAEIPLVLAGQTSIVQLQVQQDRDDREGPVRQAAAPAGWTVRFSMNAEPMGPVDAQITMRNDHVGVSLWAERSSTTHMFEQYAPDLKQALEASAFVVDGLVVAQGKPEAAKAKPAAATGPLPTHVDVSS